MHEAQVRTGIQGRLCTKSSAIHKAMIIGTFDLYAERTSQVTSKS